MSEFSFIIPFLLIFILIPLNVKYGYYETRKLSLNKLNFGYLMIGIIKILYIQIFKILLLMRRFKGN